MANIALITQNRPDVYRGGVETFANLMEKSFNNLTIFSAVNHDRVHPIPLMNEIQTNWNMGRRLWNEKIHLNNNVIISNGMSALYLLSKDPTLNLVMVQHGDYAASIRATYKKSDPMRLYALLTWGQFEKICVRRAKFIISVSRSVKQELLKYHQRDSTVIHNGINTNHFKPMEQGKARDILGLDRKKKILIFVARFTYLKGCDCIISLAKANPDLLFLCVIPGSPPTLDIENIKFVSNASYSDMPVYYSAADLLIAPSRYEGCSYTILEAMSCDLPIISRETGIFNDDTFRDIEGTTLFDNKIDRNLIESSIVGKKLGGLRSFAITNFSIEKQIQAYQDFLIRFM
jgi:glycosyltransferase involved in cell wall biosynthesis